MTVVLIHAPLAKRRVITITDLGGAHANHRDALLDTREKHGGEVADRGDLLLIRTEAAPTGP